MIRHYIKKLILTALQFLLIIMAILTALFFLQRLSGDPATVLAGHSASTEVIEGIREEMGLNEPLHVQYLVFMRQTLTLDFGESLRYQQPAMELVLDRFPNTLLLAFSAMGVAVLFGIPLGMYSAIFNRRLDGRFVNLLAGVLQAIPSFWLGLVLMLFFSVRLQWFGTVASLEDNTLRRLALPTITLSAFYIARLIRLVRSGLIEEMTQDYIITARAKGLHSRRIVLLHAFKNAAIPIIAFVSLDMSYLIGGSIVVESLFSYSGIGDLLVSSILNRDFAVVQAAVFVICLLVVTINSSSQLVYRAIDPRLTEG